MDEESQTKQILPFLQRADEIDKMEPKVAYYLRMYAVDVGLSFTSRSPKIEGVLRALLQKLEKDKVKTGIGEGDKEYCENFALTVFSRASKVDQAGHADKSTAMTFYASSVFLEILRQFGDLPPDYVEMQRYAAWKAADIRKALREGRQPTPGNGLTAPPSLASLGIDDNPSESAAAASAQEDEFGLPSVPPPVAGFPMPPRGATGLSRISSQDVDLPPSTSVPLEEPAPPLYAPGQRVLYSADASPTPLQVLQGTVAKAEMTGAGWLYTVALPTQIIQTPEETLAPEFAPGERVGYQAPDKSVSIATVVKTDSTHWRPSYSITIQDGSQRDTRDDHLLRLEHEPQAALLPPVAPAPVDAPTTASAPPTPLTQSSGPLTPGPDQTGPFFDAKPAPTPLAGASAPPPPPPQHAPPPKLPPPHTPAAYTPPPAYPPPIVQSTALPGFSAPVCLPHQSKGATPAPSLPAPVDGYQPPLAAVTEAQKYAKYAASSLGFEDIETAKKYLADAYRLLTQAP